MRPRNGNGLVITDRDLQRLESLVHRDASSTATELLDGELDRAKVVSHETIAPNVVTMNSEVVYEDTSTGLRRTVRVVYPEDADASRGYVSVLAPIGSALLGLRIGQRIEWPFPTGKRRIAVVGIPYQPESHGDYHL
jgi:regulator of nucleoside diphosphate kinase